MSEQNFVRQMQVQKLNPNYNQDDPGSEPKFLDRTVDLHAYKLVNDRLKLTPSIDNAHLAVWSGTKAQFEELTEYDIDTIYYVDGAPVGVILSSEKGTAGGVAELDLSGKVPKSQLPQMVYVQKDEPSEAPAGSLWGWTTPPQIYGVSWDGTSRTDWQRTDLATDFGVCVPYVAGMTASECYSPFDGIMPWAGMQKVEDPAAGTLVSIPKFYYKLEKHSNDAGMSIQIVNEPLDGFICSPAHMDRGDGKGERDTVYIGRYHCALTSYKSTSGGKPQTLETRSAFRTSIHSLGNTIWQSDLAMRFTLWLLYIVEFADWNSQNCIGYGCGNDSATENMGYTDSMPYHTGTTQSSRTAYGGTQYRNIEGLWDNVYDWFDGCYNNSDGLNIILNPANFSDTIGGTLIGNPSDGYPSAFNVSTSGGFPMFYPTAASGSDSTYTCDLWAFYSFFPCVLGGGSYNQDLDCGVFCIIYGTASYQTETVGSRLMKL